ncbi:MAG TPA: hypothetical protein VJZ00_05025 [Thermoanaerobaculia bacterium]|nr:hypothetical protein [Thermoanaerobaculia bacterium]
MKKALAVLIVAAFSVPAFASYIVVLKNGSQYAAKAKWTIVKGKAIIQLENGQALQVDPALIDEARSEQATKVGMANASVIDLNTNAAPAPARPQQPTLGDAVKLRRQAKPQTAQEQSIATKPMNDSVAAPVPTVPGTLGADVIDKFERAFDNIGIFERKVVPTGGRSLRADMTVDTEDRVFNAISASAFLMVKNAGVQGAQIDMVELYMRTTTNGAAGRFQMTRADAEALNNKTISQQEYFVRKVIY